MAKQERLEAQCPPDAHKVIRPPENKVNASLVVKVADFELEKYGDRDVAEVLSLFSPKPQILCSKKVEKAIVEKAQDAEIKPSFLELKDEQGFLHYLDGSVSSVKKVVDFSNDFKSYQNFLDTLSEDCYLVVDSLSMLIMRSISTVYPWDKLLASDFIRQYLGACEILDDKEIQDLFDVRYGRQEGSALKDAKAFHFLKLERKLFLQYPTDDDD